MNVALKEAHVSANKRSLSEQSDDSKISNYAFEMRQLHEFDNVCLNQMKTVANLKQWTISCLYWRKSAKNHCTQSLALISSKKWSFLCTFSLESIFFSLCLLHWLYSSSITADFHMARIKLIVYYYLAINYCIWSVCIECLCLI